LQDQAEPRAVLFAQTGRHRCEAKDLTVPILAGSTDAPA
jgi:hypothetical protein